jgi:hypothetical protein
VERSCEDGTEASGSVIGGEFVGQLSDYWLLKKDVIYLLNVLSKLLSNHSTAVLSSWVIGPAARRKFVAHS